MRIPIFACFLALLTCTTALGQTITVVTEEYPPYNYLAPNGEVAGCATRIVRMALDDAGIDYTIILAPWARAYKIALEDENVLIYSMFRSSHREKLFKWVGMVAPYSASLYAATDSTLRIRSLDEAKHHSIGTIRDSFLEQYLASKGFDLNHANRTGTLEALVHKLLIGRADMIILPNLTAAHLLRQKRYEGRLKPIFPIKDLELNGLYMAFSRPTPDALVDRVRKSLGRLHSDGRYDRALTGIMPGRDR